MDARPSRLARRLLGGAAVATALAAFAPPAATAAVTCNYDSGAEVLQVAMSADKDSAELSLGKVSKINVSVDSAFVACTGGVPVLSNTGAVTVTDSSSAGSTKFTVRDPGAFGATTTIFDAQGTGSADELKLSGSSLGDSYVLGTKGIDTDEKGEDSGDIVFFGGYPDTVTVNGNEGPDFFRAQGGVGTGGPMPKAVLLVLDGGAGLDTLIGGDGDDVIFGDAGDDFLYGEGGSDTLIPDQNGTGNEIVNGGIGGEDVVDYALSDNAVTVDLNQTGPQQTGEGTDTITGVEDVWGTLFDDKLTGDAGPNALLGFTGDDVLDGRGGTDLLDGSYDRDTVDYAAAPSAVTVDLEIGSTTGGAGPDTMLEVENVVGSPFDDTLTGDENENEIDGGAGRDLIRAEGGDDTVLARDGIADDAGCGAGTDRAVFDRLSLDKVLPDCEQVDALPEPTPGPVPGAGDTRLDFRLHGAASQRLLEKGAVVISARCPEETCALLIGMAGPGKLKSKKRRRALPPGRAKTLRLALTAAEKAALARQTSKGEHSRVRVTVVASDHAGNKVTRTLSVVAKP